MLFENKRNETKRKKDSLIRFQQDPNKRKRKRKRRENLYNNNNNVIQQELLKIQFSIFVFVTSLLLSTQSMKWMDIMIENKTKKRKNETKTTTLNEINSRQKEKNSDEIRLFRSFVHFFHHHHHHNEIETLKEEKN